MRASLDNRGQSAAEFALTAPLILLLFFCLIQAAYCTLTCLVVQRSALVAARHAARQDGTGGPAASPLLEATIALLPLADLHRSNLVALVLTRVDINRRGPEVEAVVRYPMPLCVPLAGRWFGERLNPPMDLSDSSVGKILKQAFRLSGRTTPDFSFNVAHPTYFRIITFRASAPLEAPPSRR